MNQFIRLSAHLGLLITIAAVPCSAAPSTPATSATRPICYKTTRMMWDSTLNQAVNTSPKVLQQLQRAFKLWEDASQGAIRFEFSGMEVDGHDGTSSIPYDGCVHAVLHGERNFHGELAHGHFNGDIPNAYKRGYFFVSRAPEAMNFNTLVHEIGHTLGLPHSAVPASIMFSGPRSVRNTLLTLSEQDQADLRAKWAPLSPGSFSISGVIKTDRTYPIAAVFAEEEQSQRSYSTRSDHMGRFSIAIPRSGSYKLVARPVLVASDLVEEALGGMKESWFVYDNQSTPAKTNATVFKLSESLPSISGLAFRTIDENTPNLSNKHTTKRINQVINPPPNSGKQEPPVIAISFDKGFDDEGAYHLQGQAMGDEVRLTKGIKGRALFIGGTEDWLDFELSKSINFDKGFSLELWFRRDDWTNPYKGGSGWQTIAALSSAISLSIAAPGCPLHKPWSLEGHQSRYLEDVGESDSARVISRPDSVPAKIWTHGALVYDPSDKSLKLYLDGKLVDQAKDAPVPDLKWRNLRLGTWYKANQAYRGEIDEVAIYNYPRPPQAIFQARNLEQEVRSK